MAAAGSNVSDGQYELPDSWEWKTIADVCAPIAQVNPSTTPSRKFKYVDISSISNALNQIIDVKEHLGETAPSRARKPIKAGDVLFATVRPYLRNIASVPAELDGQIASTGFCVLRATPKVDPRYLFRYVLTDYFVQRVTEEQRGISYPAVTDRDVYARDIPLAPMPEQHRIVEKIEQLLAQSLTARQALDRIPALLKQFRQAVLAAAFRGELTERDANDEPAAVLLERIHNGRRLKWEEKQKSKGKESRNVEAPGPKPLDSASLPKLPAGWSWTTIDQLAEVVRGASPRPAGDPRYFGGNVPWITVGSLTEDTSPYLWSVAEFVTEEGRKKSRYIEPETLMLTNSGATLGVPKIIKVGGCFNDGSVALLGVDYPMKLYLYYFLSSMTKKLRTINQGAAQPNLNTSIVKAIVAPIAPLAEQTRVVSKIESHFGQADTIERAVEIAQRQAKKVDQAVLARAFRGEL
jgi:type I restriction enzyme S subunit